MTGSGDTNRDIVELAKAALNSAAADSVIGRGHSRLAELVPELVDRIEDLEAMIFQIGEARIDYDYALHLREHGGVAASRFITDVLAVLDRKP